MTHVLGAVHHRHEPTEPRLERPQRRPRGTTRRLAGLIFATVALWTLVAAASALAEIGAPVTAFVAAAAPAAQGVKPALTRRPTNQLSGGSSPSAAATLGGGYAVAQQVRSGRLQVISSTGRRESFRAQLAPGTRPSIAALFQGSVYEVAFQGRSGQLMVAAPGGSIRRIGVRVMPGTSPSISASRGGCCDVAFQGTDGKLAVWTPGGGVADTGQAMAPGASPSLAEETSGAFAVAYVGANDDLFTYTPSTGATDSHATAAAGSDPSIAATTQADAYEVAFTAAGGHLSLLNTQGLGATRTKVAVAANTSPSLAALAGGGWILAVHGANGHLVTETSAGVVRRSAKRLAARTSPAEVASPPIANPYGRSMFGIATDGAIELESRGSMIRDLNLDAAAGAKWLRVNINWAVIQASGRHSYNWRSTDRVVRAAQARGMHVLGIIIYTPPWAEASHSCPQADCAPNPVDFASFAHAAVAHYAGFGVSAYEIWSEENTTAQWLPRPNPQAYTTLLKDAYPQIKRADPNATVITGGTSPSTNQTPNYSPPAFIAALYRDGAKGSFDAVGVHPYCWPALPGQAESWSAWFQTVGAKNSIRNVMVRHGDGNKLIWGTEFGAATYGPKGSYVSKSRQAATILKGYALWSTYSFAGPLIVFEGRDQATYSSTETVWNYLGLLYRNFEKKPAYSAFQAAASLY